MIPIGLILTELLNNSLKHGFKDTKEASVALTLIEEGQDITIKFCDNGKGYASDVFGNIDQLDSFGLMIIKGLIDQLDGKIRFYNNGGACTEIRVSY